MIPVEGMSKSVFRETHAARIPSEWELNSIESVIAQVISGDWGDESDDPEHELTRCTVIRGTDFPDAAAGLLLNAPVRYIKSSRIPKKHLQHDDILIEISGGSKKQPTGRMLRVTAEFIAKSDDPLLCTNFVKLLRLDPNNVDVDYFACYWLYLYMLGRTVPYEKRTTNIRNFKYQDFIQSEKIPLPSLPEQRRIAAVLNPIQDEIAVQGDILRALRAFQRCVIARLFTYGVGDMSVETKMTAVGEIPVSWECVPLKNIVTFTRKPRGLDLSSFERIPFIPMQLISERDTYITRYDPRTLGEIKSGTYCERGDLLIAKITPSFENGKQGILTGIPSDFAYATTEIYALKPTAPVIDSMFLFFFFKLDHIRQKIASKMQGTTGRQRVPKSVLENQAVPIPPEYEQRRIAAALNAIQDKIAAEEDREAALHAFFRSMLSQLMIGQIRLLSNEGLPL